MNHVSKIYTNYFSNDEKRLIPRLEKVKRCGIVVHPDLFPWIKKCDIDDSSSVLLEGDFEGITKAVDIMKLLLIVSPNEGSLKSQLQKLLKPKSIRIYRLFGDVFANVLCSVPVYQSYSGSATSIFEDETKICLVTSLPRSGSTFFVDVFSRTGKFGNPREHIRQDLSYLVKHGFLNFKEVFERIVRNTRSPNDVFMTKIIDGFFWSMFGWMTEDEKAFVKRLLNQSKIVYLERQDKIAQAVSAFKSQKSRKFHSTMHGAESVEVAYSYEEILEVYQKYCKKEEKWKNFIKEEAKDLLFVNYEEFAEDPLLYFNTVSSFYGVNLPKSEYKESQYKKVANDNSDYLIERFTNDLEKVRGFEESNNR